ncbi:hypothetical protein AVEN_27846-1, partial [Araneus ventricosus]
MDVRELVGGGSIAIFVIFLTLAKLNPVASPQGTLSHFIASAHLPKRKKRETSAFEGWRAPKMGGQYASGTF